MMLYTCRWCKVDPIKGKGSILKMCSACYELDVCAGCGRRDGERVTRHQCLECAEGIEKKSPVAGYLAKNSATCLKCNYYFNGPLCGRCGPEVQTYRLEKFDLTSLDPGELFVVTFPYTSSMELRASFSPSRSPSRNLVRTRTTRLAASPRRMISINVDGLNLSPQSRIEFTCDHWNQFKIFPGDSTFVVPDIGLLRLGDRQKSTIDIPTPPPINYRDLLPVSQEGSELESSFEQVISLEQMMKLDPPPPVPTASAKLPPLVDLNPRRKISFNDE